MAAGQPGSLHGAARDASKTVPAFNVPSSPHKKTDRGQARTGAQFVSFNFTNNLIHAGTSNAMNAGPGRTNEPALDC
jgi:hypothetical protein